MTTLGKWKLPSVDRVISRSKVIRDSELECPKCGIEMTKSWNEFHLVCPKCSISYPIGETEEHHTITAGETHNTSSNAYMSFKPVGAKNRLYMNTMVKYTSEYEPYRDKQILQLLTQFNFINEEFKLPMDVIRASCEMFITLRSHEYIVRGKTRRGVLGACIYVQCQKAKVTKTKAQIATMLKIEEAKITFGLKELQQYGKIGVVDIPENVDPTNDYIDRFFEIFDIPQEYKQFILDLIDRMNKKRIEECMQCFNTTKCIGVIFFLNKLLDLGITHEQIAANCSNITRDTYLNISNAIQNNEIKLKKVFIKHKVKLPPNWSK